jgi:hypothetical protein
VALACLSAPAMNGWARHYAWLAAALKLSYCFVPIGSALFACSLLFERPALHYRWVLLYSAFIFVAMQPSLGVMAVGAVLLLFAAWYCERGRREAASALVAAAGLLVAEEMLWHTLQGNL